MKHLNHASQARRQFYTLIQQPEPYLDLAQAALCLSWEEQGRNNVQTGLAQIDALANELRARLNEGRTPSQRVSILNRYLFHEIGFRGNTKNYYDPRNSFLDEVLNSHVGIPITLSVITLEIGWRLNLPFSGVALPGHFLIRYTTPQEAFYIDPFNRGRLWSYDDCIRQIQTTYTQNDDALIQTILQPPSRRAILIRILRNLKHIYTANRNFPRALATVDRIILLAPGTAEEIRDRALIHSRLGHKHSALEDLEHYATLAPAAPDLPDLQRYAQTLAEEMARGN